MSLTSNGHDLGKGHGDASEGLPSRDGHVGLVFKYLVEGEVVAFLEILPSYMF